MTSYSEQFLTEVRSDREEFCFLKDRTILIVDEICLSRLRDAACRNCRLDVYEIEAKILWLLIDGLEDTTEKRRLQRK